MSLSFRQKIALQDLFEQWWDAQNELFGESFGSNARAISHNTIVQAKEWIDGLLPVHPTQAMQDAINRGSL